jgi:hypothetical protein
MSSLNSALRHNSTNQTVEEHVNTLPYDPLQVKKQGEGFVSHWKMGNKQKKNATPYQTLIVPPPSQIPHTLPTTPQSAPPHFSNYGYNEDYSPRTRNYYESPTTMYHQQPFPQQQRAPPPYVQQPIHNPPPIQQPAQNPPPIQQQPNIPQPYIEYSFVSHNSKGKRGRRKKSVTIMSTQNPFATNFAETTTQNVPSPRQYTNIPNTSFTSYSPNTGVSKKPSKMKTGGPRISVREVPTPSLESTSPIVTSSTVEETIIVSKKDETEILPPMQVLPDPSTPNTAEYNHNRLRRVSIKNLLC